MGDNKIAQQSTSQKDYIEWLRQAAEHQHPVHKNRLAQAWRTARHAAQLLRKNYGVGRVRVFGSLLYPNQFNINSDVDLAVEGLADRNYWDALADILFLNDEITVDLVEPSSCPPAIWATVEREGVDL